MYSREKGYQSAYLDAMFDLIIQNKVEASKIIFE